MMIFHCLRTLNTKYFFYDLGINKNCLFVCFRLLVMQGWFDAFRNNGGPTLYNFNNRTAVTGDVTLITFLVIFSTIYVAFLVIFPGIRKEVRDRLPDSNRK